MRPCSSLSTGDKAGSKAIETQRIAEVQGCAFSEQSDGSAASSTPSIIATRHICLKRYSQSAPADYVPGFGHLPSHSWTALYHGCVLSAGPATWNALPDNIRIVADPVNFRKLLKSYYLRIAFSVRWSV